MVQNQTRAMAQLQMMATDQADQALQLSERVPGNWRKDIIRLQLFLQNQRCFGSPFQKIFP
jgi:hypothetical protein